MRAPEKPEIVIALAGPIGTDLHTLAESLDESLLPFGYQCHRIRVSQLIEFKCKQDLADKITNAKHDERIKLLMAAGDTLRNQTSHGDALVPLIVAAIRSQRSKVLAERGVQDPDVPAHNTCYIIDSLKHPDEVRALKGMYNQNFILISAFTSREERKANLAALISKSYMSTSDNDYIESAQSLIEIDSKRDGSQIGQSLRDTFPLADLFIRLSSDFKLKLDRFLSLYFGSPYITPNRDEFFMYEAKAKSYRSADLSRQIGAVIVDKGQHLVASGCNEVPLAGGGSYWPDMDDKLDNRDYKKGRDFNAVKKIEIIQELISFLSKESIVTFPEGKNAESIVNDLIFGDFESQFKELRVSNLIEFGRVVHAEMNAITEAAKRGIEIGGGQIFSTTFPCHMCARHIIASGICRVVYIEPYPKSMTEDLYGDMVIVDAIPAAYDESQDKKGSHGPVAFEPFEGVAPTFYRELFQAPTRKDRQGYTKPWAKLSSQPKIARISTVHLGLEQALVKAVEQLREVGIEEVINSIEG
jgi:cytidine deaminase